MIVLLSSALHHPVGQRISEQTAWSLANHKDVLVLGHAGTRRICGPHRGRLSPGLASCPQAQTDRRVGVAVARADAPLRGLFDIGLLRRYPADPATVAVQGRPNRVVLRWAVGEPYFRLAGSFRVTDGVNLIVEERAPGANHSPHPAHPASPRLRRAIA